MGRPMPKRRRIVLIWSQLAAYHIDRVEAVARRLNGRFEVEVIEVASRSTIYAWEESGRVKGARKRTLFPGREFERVSPARRFGATLRSVRGAAWCFNGVPPGEKDSVALSFALLLTGTRSVLLNDSKLDDFPRRAWFEAFKTALYWAYAGAIVAGQRQIEFMRFLGFRRRALLAGYDTVGVDRILAEGGGRLAEHAEDFATRPFVFVGRLVTKKNVPVLIRAYARYRVLAGPRARRLVLAGAGEQQPAIERLVAELGLANAIEFAGFLRTEQVSQALASSLALILPSREEQWGLVVNEAIACGLPLIVSENVGARDVLVDNLVNGFVVPACSIEGLAQAMAAMGDDEARWRSMAHESARRRWYADAERFADAVETMILGDASPSAPAVARMSQALVSREI